MVFDSGLLRNMFGTEEMRAIVSEAGYLTRRLEVEAALAAAHRPAAIGLRCFRGDSSIFSAFFCA
jgi:hypothetical protein